MREWRDAAPFQTLQGRKLERHDVFVKLERGQVGKRRNDVVETRHRDDERTVFVHGCSPHKRRQVHPDAPWESIRVVRDHDVAQLEPLQFWGVPSIKETGSGPSRTNVAVHHDVA